MNALYHNQSIAVLGAGESGAAAAQLLHEEGAVITILDTAEEPLLRKKIQTLAKQGIRLLAGPDAEQASAQGSYQLAVLSPGIDPSVPLVQNFIRRRIAMIGELELASQMCPCPIVAITGTNGKTTTTELVEKLFTDSGVKTVACGNIGPSFSSKIRATPHLDIVTLEVSSFQLESIQRFHPKIAVWLGFAPDHLDRYPSVDAYFQAKIRIFENQTPDDWAVVNFRDHLPNIKAQKLTFSAYTTGADFELRAQTIFFRDQPVLSLSQTQLRGVHNAENLMAALAVGWIHGLTFPQMVAPLSAYVALPHRCEFIGNYQGVDYVNDSKGTNPDAVEKALLSQTRPVILIAGGKDKGFDYSALSTLVAERCKAVVVLGEMADQIASLWQNHLPVLHAGRSLKDAVDRARQFAQPGDTVLLSPGTSSFDMFTSYADRGDQFRDLVQALSQK